MQFNQSKDNVMGMEHRDNRLDIIGQGWPVVLRCYTNFISVVCSRLVNIIPKPDLKRPSHPRDCHSIQWKVTDLPWTGQQQSFARKCTYFTLKHTKHFMYWSWPTGHRELSELFFLKWITFHRPSMHCSTTFATFPCNLYNPSQFKSTAKHCSESCCFPLLLSLSIYSRFPSKTSICLSP